MFPIVRIPKSVQQRFFSNEELRALFSKPQWKHFQEIVLAIIMAFGRRNIKTQAQQLATGTARTSLGDFYTQAPVDTEAVMMRLARQHLRKLKVEKGDLVELIIDDSHGRRRGKKIETAGKYYDAALKAYLHGHNFIAGVLRVGNRVIPLDVRLAYKKVWAKRLKLPFRTLNDLAVLLIDSFAPMAEEMELEVRVLFDSYYMNKKVVGAVERHGWIYVSVLPSNRAPKIRGRKTQVGRYRRCIPRKQYRKIWCATEEGKKAYWTTSRKAFLNKIGIVKIVFSKRRPNEKALPIVTNAVGVNMRTICEWYSRRWAIEVHFFKAAKQLLGLTEFQTGKAEGIQKHLRLVACVFSLLAVETLGWEQQTEKKKTKRRGFRLREARDGIRREVFEDLLDFLEESKDPKAVIRQLRKLYRDSAA